MAAVAVIGSDALCVAVADELARRDVEVVGTCGAELGELPMSLDADGFRLDGRALAGLVVREPVRSIAPLSFASEDQTFVLAELSATLLAAANRNTLLAINRLDAESWFEDGEWPVWRRRLRSVGVPVSPMSFGDRDGAGDGCWRPYVGGAERPVPDAAVRRALGTALGHDRVAGRVLCAFGEVFDSAAPVAVRHASRLLGDGGLALKAISYDAAGRVVAVDPLPAVPDSVVEAVAVPLASALHDHLHHG